MKLVSFWCDIKYLDYILHVLGCTRVNLHVQVRISSDMFKKKKDMVPRIVTKIYDIYSLIFSKVSRKIKFLKNETINDVLFPQIKSA